MICKECGSYVSNPRTNQKRCRPCIAANPHRGAHAAGKLGDRYVRQARKQLSAGLKHWNKSMPVSKFRKLFPDIDIRNVKN